MSMSVGTTPMAGSHSINVALSRVRATSASLVPTPPPLFTALELGTDFLVALEPLFFACPARADGLLVLICDHTVVTHRQQAQVHGQGPALHDAPLQHIARPC
jgi:hypothetical protein